MVFQIVITFDDDTQQSGKGIINAEFPSGDLDHFATVSFQNKKVGDVFFYDELHFKQDYINQEYPDGEKHYLSITKEFKRSLETFYEVLGGRVYVYS